MVAAVPGEFSVDDTGEYTTDVHNRCTKKVRPCTQRFVREEALLAQMGAVISKISIDIDTRDKVLNRWESQVSEASNASASRSRQIAQRLQECDSHMERLLDLYVAREIMPEEYQRKKAKLLNEKQELKEALGDLARSRGGGVAGLVHQTFPPVEDFVSCLGVD